MIDKQIMIIEQLILDIDNCIGFPRAASQLIIEIFKKIVKHKNQLIDTSHSF